MSTVNLSMVRGAGPAIDLTIKKLDGSAYDLTGCSVTMTAKRSADDPDSAAVFRKTTGGGGITVTNAAGGLATVQLSAADTRNVPGDVDLAYDVTVKTGAGSVSKPIVGKLTVAADVSHVPA